ncbi:MAG: response regulator [Trueperaceae bacterium]|nr:response regulator [Trueperaceae bacterium]
MASPTFHVLVADPDRMQLQLVDMLLSSGQYDVHMVESGRDALEHLKGATPDIALLALNLDDVPGDVICGKIRRVSRLARTPVILIAPQSGRFGLDDASRARARRVGADLVLPRPLGDKNLRERVQGLLDAREYTPPREGHSTVIIEEALEEIPLEGEGAAPPPGRDAQEAPPAPRNATPPPADEPATLAGASDADQASPEDQETLARLRHEVERLELENTQLRRKLAERANERKARDEATQKTITELERRNKSLLDALEELKGRGGNEGRGGGLFGRRK